MGWVERVGIGGGRFVAEIEHQLLLLHHPESARLSLDLELPLLTLAVYLLFPETLVVEVWALALLPQAERAV